MRKHAVRGANWRSCLSMGFKGALAASAGLAGPAMAQGVYAVTDLGGLGGPSAIAWGISAGGTVVGQAKDVANHDRPFVWDSIGGMIDLGTLGGQSGIAYDINDSGVVVGSSRSAGNIDRAFIWDAISGLRAVPGPAASRPSYAFAVNASGRVVGSLFNSAGVERAFISDPVLGLIDPFPGSPYACSARGVNEAGQVTGYQSFTAGTDAQGYRWTNAATISYFGPSFSTHPYGINAAGSVVGEQDSSAAFRWAPPATYVNLPTTPFHTDRAYAINSGGLVVGYGRDIANHRHGFVYSDLSGLIDLNTVMSSSSGLELTEAHDINDSGRIVGVATDGAGQSRAVMLTPASVQPVLYVSAASSTGGNGASWATAFRSLQDALTLASLSGGVVQEIWVAQGVYVPTRRTNPTDPNSATFQLLRDVGVYGGFAGTETLRDQRDWISHPTVLSGDLNGNDGPNFANYADNAKHVVTATLTPVDATCTLDGFTVSGGNAPVGNPDFDGGGIYASFGSTVFRHLTIRANSAYHTGGGAAAFGGRERFELCTFSGNRALSGAAGLVVQVQAVVNRCTFVGNNVPSGGSSAGALSAQDNAVVSGCMFTGNSVGGSGSGGAVVLSGQAILINATVVGNSAPGGYGGGVQATSGTQVTNCLINGNTSFWGAGIAGSSQITNCTIVHNSASQAGGGFFGLGPAATITSCILWANSGPGLPGESFQLGGTTNPSVNYSCSQYWTGLFGGVGNFGANPRFVNENGPDNMPGTSDDDLHLVHPISPCIDSGNNNALPPDTTDLDGDSNTVETLPVDLDFNPRTRDDPAVADAGQGPGPVVDCGCFEVQPPACYANCDGSTTPPVLNVIDFACFLNRYASGDPYANCDGSTTPPVLNVIDFACFLNLYAAGCP